MEKTHNGWTNYATWRVALEIFDGLEPEPHMDAEWCQGWTETIILSDTNNGLAQDYAMAFINQVNWREIAENIQEMRDLSNYIFSEEDRDRIEFDEHGRPYIQDGGRMMLSRKTKYNYTIKNS